MVRSRGGFIGHRPSRHVTTLSIRVVALLLGMKHATEVDHLAAVATFATRAGSFTQTLRQGVTWGAGHTLTLMLFGGLLFVLGQSVPPGLEHALETAVGVMLVLLGTDVLRRLARERIHFHVHDHAAATVHVHAHSYRGETAPRKESSHQHAHRSRSWPLRALAVG